MTSTFVLRVFAHVAVACALAVNVVQAQGREAAHAPIQIVDDTPLNAGWTAVERGVVVMQVLNTSDADVPARIFVSSFEFAVAKASLANGKVLSLGADPSNVSTSAEGARVVLRRNTVTTFRVKPIAGAPALDAGRYPRQGYAVFTVAPTTGPALSRKVVIEVAAAAAAAPSAQPLVTEVRAWAYRFSRWNDITKCPSCSVPVRDGTLPPAGTEIGRLAGKRADSARVVVVGTSKSPSAMVLQFAPTDVGATGEYAGTLQLGAADDKKTSVAFTLTVKDKIFLPIAVLVLGSVAALALKRYLGVTRVDWDLRGREAELEITFAASCASYKRAAAGQPYAESSLDKPFQLERAQLISKIDQTTGRAWTSIDQTKPPYTEIEAALSRLNSVARSWASLPAVLAPLNAARDAVADAAKKLPAVDGPPPVRILEVLAPVLEAKVFGTLDEYDAFRQQLPALRTFAEEWKKQAADVAAAVARLKRLQDEGNADQPVLDKAEELLRTVTFELRQAADVDDLVESKVHALINEAEALLQEAAEPVMGITTFGLTGSFQLHRSLPARMSVHVVKVEKTGAVPKDPVERRAFYANRRWSMDLVMTFIAFTIALLTGLQKFYFDKPFGSFNDYLSLALLALGTRAATEAVAAALEWSLSKPTFPVQSEK